MHPMRIPCVPVRLPYSYRKRTIGRPEPPVRRSALRSSAAPPAMRLPPLRPGCAARTGRGSPPRTDFRGPTFVSVRCWRDQAQLRGRMRASSLMLSASARTSAPR